MIFASLRPYLPFLLLFALATSQVPDWPQQLLFLSEWIALAWVIQSFNRFLLNGKLSTTLGLKPRQISGLPGILACPLLHDCRHNSQGKGHLFYNTFGFLFTGWLVLLLGLEVFYIVTLFVTLVGGGLTWLFARNEDGKSHVGASGLIYGYTGFLLAYGLVARTVFPLAVTVVVALEGLGRTLEGIRPNQPPGISWEGHLFGLLSGVMAAIYLDELYNLFAQMMWEWHLRA